MNKLFKLKNINHSIVIDHPMKELFIELIIRADLIREKLYIILHGDEISNYNYIAPKRNNNFLYNRNLTLFWGILE